jgi:hypothetical protein
VKKNAKRPTKGKLPKRFEATVADDSPQEAAHGTSATASFPIYILHLGASVQIVFPENREDIGHTDFWDDTVCLLVARHFQIPPRKLSNLPYCQRRARIVGNKVYYGETPDPDLLRLIREAIGNPELVFCYDDHEKRIPLEVLQFKRLVRRSRSG